jgi:hypothetical protein
VAEDGDQWEVLVMNFAISQERAVSRPLSQKDSAVWI